MSNKWLVLWFIPLLFLFGCHSEVREQKAVEAPVKDSTQRIVNIHSAQSLPHYSKNKPALDRGNKYFPNKDCNCFALAENAKNDSILLGGWYMEYSLSSYLEFRNDGTFHEDLDTDQIIGKPATGTYTFNGSSGTLSYNDKSKPQTPFYLLLVPLKPNEYVYHSVDVRSNFQFLLGVLRREEGHEWYIYYID